MMSRPRLHLPVQAMVCVAAFGFGLPLAIALFPQTSQVRSLITKKVYATLLIRPSLINGWLNYLGSRFRRGRLGVCFPTRTNIQGLNLGEGVAFISHLQLLRHFKTVQKKKKVNERSY